MTSPEPSAPTLWTRIHRVPLVLQIAAGMLLGIVLALVWPAAARSVALLGDVFVMALKSVAPVLVLVLVAASIASHKRGHDTRFRPAPPHTRRAPGRRCPSAPVPPVAGSRRWGRSRW